MPTASELRAFIYTAPPACPRKYPVVALAGNPNTGKSTVFNALTGLRQHTGNWPGKTVLLARGLCRHEKRTYELVDLPGSYSLHAHSPDEEATRDFLCWGQPDAVIVVVDAGCLERNLNLVLQVLELTGRVVISLNLIDEARKKQIRVDHKLLARDLGVPVIPCVARKGTGLNRLMTAVRLVTAGEIITNPRLVRYPAEIEAAVQKTAAKIKGLVPAHLPLRWVALRLLSGDRQFYRSLCRRQQRRALIKEVITG